MEGGRHTVLKFVCCLLFSGDLSSHEDLQISWDPEGFQSFPTVAIIRILCAEKRALLDNLDSCISAMVPLAFLDKANTGCNFCVCLCTGDGHSA